MRPRTRIVIALALAAAAVGVVLGGYAAVAPAQKARWADPADTWGCGSAHPIVSPSPVVRGEDVTLSAGSARCVRKLPAGTDFALTLVPLNGSATSEQFVHSETPVASDGSFTVTFTVPDDFPIGQAGVTIGDGDYVPCHDGGTGRSDGIELASCAASEVFFEVAG